ncbi:MAG TPA: VOC family protein [Anaerolineales bacterium]|nr:VOC family protein [Anaerolineales bacterium]
MKIKNIHHVAIICSDYQRSKDFYTNGLGFTIKAEYYRSARDSYKLDLEINGLYQIELFSFPNSPERPSYPEAKGLRHLALVVENIEETLSELRSKGIQTEEIRIDECTGKRFVFFKDPDGLPLELYEE